MRCLIVSTIIGSLMLIGVHDASGQPLPTDRPVQLDVNSDTAAGRDTYVRRARDDLADWKLKLDEYGEKVKIEGQKDSTAVENDLNKAWIKTKAEAGKLQSAGAGDWESARVSYEKALRELRDDWHKIGGADR